MEFKFTNYDKDKPYFVPKKASKDASGYDLYAINEEPYYLKPGEIKLFDTNIAILGHHGIEGQVRSRSGLALKNGIFVLNSPGTIDSDYRGPVGIILANLGTETFEVTKGMRIAQLVFTQVSIIDLEYTDNIIDTPRGNGGFGSTGLK